MGKEMKKGRSIRMGGGKGRCQRKRRKIKEIKVEKEPLGH
jgi:hypothetical protein